MSRNRWIISGIALIVALAGIVLGLMNSQKAASGVTLSERFENSASIHFSYPAGWQFVIPEQNIIFLGSPEVLNQEIGASITIQRSLRLMTEVETLDDALTLFLERGPLADGPAWEVIEAARAIQIDGRDARITVLEGADIEGAERLRSEIAVTESDSGVYYVFAATAGIAQWPETEPIIQAILDSVDILE
ncbi:MAG: hypothetical protein H6670_08650 [Anaerolineaceae bacterium]|nr:hypothetical protein [Anaerolineaceae bacterium]